MKWVIFVVLAMTLSFFIACDCSIVKESDETEGVTSSTETAETEEEPLTPESQMEKISRQAEEYRGTVNDGITLEQLQNSKVVTELKIYNWGPHEDPLPYAIAGIYIKEAEVVAINERTLTLYSDGDTLSIYVGENVQIRIRQGMAIRDGKIEEVRVGNYVSTGGYLQFAHGDPLWIKFLSVH